MRSCLRRYPRALVESIIGRNKQEPPVSELLLHELAPHDLAVSWLGHAGVACQLGERVLLVDPVLSERIGPRIGRRTIGLARQRTLPTSPASLRGVHAVLITHAHFDHLDKPTLRALASEETAVITPPNCARLVPRGFAEVIELRPGDRTEYAGVELEALQPRHWGARVALDRHRGVNSYIARAEAGSMLFVGDTAETNAFNSINVDLAVFGIGAYDPWEHMHATPEQVWRMFKDTQAEWLLPVHHSTFELSDEPMDDPLRRLLDAATGEHHRILTCDPGEVVTISTAGPT